MTTISIPAAATRPTVTGPAVGEWTLTGIPARDELILLPNGDTGRVAVVDYRPGRTTAYVQTHCTHSIPVQGAQAPEGVRTVMAALGDAADRVRLREAGDGVVDVIVEPHVPVGTVQRNALEATPGILAARLVSGRYGMVYRVWVDGADRRAAIGRLAAESGATTQEVILSGQLTGLTSPGAAVIGDAGDTVTVLWSSPHADWGRAYGPGRHGAVRRSDLAAATSRPAPEHDREAAAVRIAEGAAVMRRAVPADLADSPCLTLGDAAELAEEYLAVRARVERLRGFRAAVRPSHLISELRAVRDELDEGLGDGQRDTPSGRAWARLAALITALEG